MSAQKPSVRSSSTTNIPVRRLELALDDANTPRDYYGDDVYLTTMWNALSVLFPEGEKFFVDSVRNFRDQIDDPELAAEIMAFVGQEAMHAKEHDLFTTLLDAQGQSVAPKVDVWLRGLLGRVRTHFSPANQLAVTCALEHFTALLAESLLEHETQYAMFAGRAQGLWYWHALEETEHKSVAFDVYEKVDGSYARRAFVMIIASAVFWAVAGTVYAQMLRERGALSSPRGLTRYARHYWGRGGVFSRLIPSYLAYFKPGFHPNDRDTSALVASWNERLFGEAGVLRAQLRQIRAMAPRAIAA